MGKQKSVKGGSSGTVSDDAVFNMDKFLGEGVMFNCKLFGSLKVDAPRGDTICATAMNKLKQQAKQLNKESKIHKQRIFLNISLKGIRIIDQKTKKLENAHLVHKISYISHDKDDRRTFAYIVSLQDGYNLFAFRTEKNAENITANLKELFHVIYLKHKQEREKGGKSTNPDQPNTDTQQDEEIETAVEETEQTDENPYAVPSKFQLVEKTTEEPSHYDVPQSRNGLNNDEDNQNLIQGVEEPANLLDWTDVNEELEFMHKDMKRSDTKQLLAELGDLNMDANPPQLSEKPNIFSDDPFFDASPFSSADDQGGLKSSSSDPNLMPKNNPFLSTQNGNLQLPSTNLSKSKSMDNGLFDANDLFSSSQEHTPQAGNPTLLSQVGDIFSSVPASQQQSSAWSTSHQGQNGGSWGSSAPNKNSPFDAFNMDQQTASTLSPTMNDNSLFASLEPEKTSQLVPEKISVEKERKDDPFAALAGGISSIKDTLPVADGESMPQFPKKNKSTPTSARNSPMTISQGPTLHPNQLQSQQMPLQNQQTMNQNVFQPQTNPFNQPSMPCQTGFPPQNSNRPTIPPRVDLMSQGGNFHSPSAPQMPFTQQNVQPFLTQGSTVSSDPFSGLGNAFSLNNTVTSSEPLYATVDKSRKTNNPSGSQPNNDMFAIFDNKQTTNARQADTMGDPFGQINTNTNTSVQSNRDPFGDFGSF